MRKWLLGALALASIVPAAAADTFEGVMTISHGFYVDQQGRHISLVGKKVPYVGERIELNQPARPGTIQGLDATVYSNDHGAGSYIVSGLAMPSALDDVTMSGGANAIWQQMTVGINVNSTNPFETIMWRWTAYGTFTPGLGSGVMAFSNMLLDFGGAFPLLQLPSVPGTYKVTFNIAGFNLSSSQNQLYFVQQFRHWQGGNPDAPFRMDIDNVFSRGFPSPGNSLETFYFDFEPDNIFDENEIDQWEAGNEANFLLQILANSGGTIETRSPSSFAYEVGTPVSGGLSDLWDSDNFYVNARPGVVFTTQQAPLRMVVTSTSTTTTPTLVAMVVEGKSSSASIQQKVEFWNYNTSAWVLGDTRQTTTGDTTIEVVAPGTASHYVHPTTRQIQTRLSYRATGPVLSHPWNVSWDQAVWKITRP